MRTIRDYQFIADEDRGAVAAIGNFDGVHLGHQAKGSRCWGEIFTWMWFKCECSDV